ncbi:uncharacterized protein LOC134826584 isoform X2 [Bolinopsis microptera]|uniref:uncharacterized protein LOC134826584 isoform X2 n=1 Tax=Bolinopsis microptera TaxID=2820187 RepID=UPI00307A1534
MLLFVALSLALHLANADLKLNVICDDQMTLWINGVQTDVAGQGAWNQMSTISLGPAGATNVIGIKCLNTGGPYGIMGSVEDESGNNVLVTDNSWSCSNAADAGWEQAGFVEGDNWNAASYYPHRVYITNNGPWAAAMSANKQIIWTASAADTTVYCRKVISGCSNSNWGQYNGKYLSGYSAGVAKYDTVSAAVAECPKRPDCGGITYEPYSGKYTLRKGSELKASPSKEISWKINPYLSLNVICDDQMLLWVDGVQTNVAGQGAWNQMSSLKIPDTTQVIGIKCLNTGGPYGIMGSIQDAAGNDVAVTDNSWSCSNAADDGWEKADFVEGDNWNAASYYPHRVYITNNGPWAAAMSANKQIIWTASAADTNVYCRKVIQKPAIVSVNVESLGCWRDTAVRAIATIEGSVSSLTGSYISRANAFDKCLKATLALGNKVFALQHGGWCATAANAGDTYKKYGPSSSCADDGQGGPWGNQVYKINC